MCDTSSLIFSTKSADMCFKILFFIVPRYRLDVHTFEDWLSLWTTKINHVQFFCIKSIATAFSAIRVVRTYSSQQEIKLIVCRVRDLVVNVAFLHCAIRPLVFLHVVTWLAQAVCVHVDKLRMCNDFDQAFCTRKAYQFFWYASDSSRRSVWTCVLAIFFALTMTFCRSWHMH